MGKIVAKDIPAYVRHCYDVARKANRKNREQEELRLKFYVGGDLQWRDEELTKRRNQNRPWVTVNRCKPAVDQIEGDIRLNPPGPSVAPAGDGADPDTADIIAGLIREVEYRSGSKTCYSTAGKYVAASGCGYLELKTEWTGDRSFQQQLTIESIEDPSAVFFDPSARMANRQDAAWAGKLKSYTKPEYVAAFGRDRKILKPRLFQSSMGWIQEALGIEGEMSELNEWTGAGDGPFYVAEFYLVETNPTKLVMWDDNIPRFQDEPAPINARPLPGPENTREVPRRTVKKYLVDAFEILNETEWIGDLIPIFPVLGPEVYIDGKLHRLSLIAGAIDPQRALNYVSTTATELAGALPKSPWIGPAGTFDDPRWQTANSEMWAYLEYKPVFVTDETTGAQSLAPAPQRNMWEAPIQWLLALGAYFSDAIKAVTSVYDPSLGQQKNEQSGKAIEQLRSESSVGNISYSDNLHRAIEVMYGQMLLIFPKILSQSQVVTIVRPDSQHETAVINQIFPEGIDPQTGKRGKPNNIGIGRYSVRVTAGPSFQTRQEQEIQALTAFFQAAPQVLAAPGVAAKYLRMIGEGNPKVESMADLLEPKGSQDGQNPQAAQQALQQAQQQNQALMVLVQKLQAAIQAKLPEQETKKWTTVVDALTKIRVAEISAGVDAAANETSHLEALAGFAHDAAKQAVEHEHAGKMAEAQGAQQSQLSAQNAAQAQQQQQESQPEGAE